MTDGVANPVQHQVQTPSCIKIDLGISLGCPLSPLMGGVYLKPLDDAMTNTGLFYARFMDDWVVLARNRGELRAAVKLANEVLEGLRVVKHPEKTFVGRVERGFEFLGYRFDGNSGLEGVDVAGSPWHNHFARLESLAGDGADGERLAEYQKFWWRWVESGVDLNL